MALLPWEIDAGAVSGTGTPAPTNDDEVAAHMAAVDDYLAANPLGPPDPADGWQNWSTPTGVGTTEPVQAPSPAPAPAPAPAGSGGGGGTGGSTGGGGGGGSSMASQLASDLAGLDAELEAERQRLAGQFELAETDQERESLARAMAALDRRYEESKVMLANAYARADAEVAGIASDADARREAQMLEVMAAMEAQARRLGEIDMVTAARDADYGVGAGLGPERGGVAYADELATLAGIEGNYSAGLSEVAAQDLDWLANLLALEEAAAAGDLERATADREGAMQAAHSARVQDRINAERMALAQLDQGLLDMFMGRRGDLESQLLQQEMFAAEMAQQRALAASRSSGGSSGGGATDPELERMLNDRDLIDLAANGVSPDVLRTYATRNGYDLGLVDALVSQVSPPDPPGGYDGPYATVRNSDTVVRNRTYAGQPRGIR